MNTLLITAAIIALAFAMLLSLAVLVSMGTWYVVYYIVGCRRAPIQKTAISVCLILWVICGALISLLP